MTAYLEHLASAEHVVYRFYDGEGNLLYVGMTSDFARRRLQHQGEKEWWPDVDESRTVIEPYFGRAIAFAIEASTIEAETPLYNLTPGRPRGELDANRRKRLVRLAEKADAAKSDLKAEAVRALMDGGSFAWVAEVTGLSTNTLQRWKREAQG